MIGSCRGDPNNVDIPAATKAGIPVLSAPGRNADAVAEITIALLFAVNRFLVPADHDVRAGQVYAGGKIPYQRYRAWQLAGRTAGIVGLGAVGRATQWRLQGLGMRVLAYDPYNPDATHTDSRRDAAGVRRRLDARGRHARDRRPHGRRAVRADEAGCDLRQQRACAAARHRRARPPRSSRDTSAAPASTTSRARTCRPTIRCSELHNVVLTPHIGGATYDTEANHSKLIADDVARILRGERPVHCVNPEVL